MIVPCYAKPTKKPTSKTPRDGEMDVPLSSVQSLYECRAEVIITHAPCTSGAWETHAQPVKPLKNGYLDDVVPISFVLVEEAATRWMGLRVLTRRGKYLVSIPGCLPLLNIGKLKIRLIDQRL
jgi:hypothetical protein